MASRADETYEDVYAGFEWDAVLEQTSWDPPELNMAHEAVDRHAGGDDVGFVWVATDGSASEYTFTDLRETSNSVANALEEMGVEKGSRVAVLLPKVPETIVTILGIWKVGAIHVPLFTAFESEALRYRMNDCQPRVLVVHADYRETVAEFADDIESLERQIVVGDESGADGESFAELVDSHPGSYGVARTSIDDPSTIQYTSGTTGQPKGVVMSHNVLGILYPHTKYALDVTEDDVVWGAADPAWSYGLFTSGFAPMSFGATRLLHAGEFDADHWVDILDRHEVTILGSAPSAYRGVMAAGEDVLAGRTFDDLRVMSSAGEPLNPEVIRWFEEHVGMPIYDTYGLTEGGMVINNYPALDVGHKKGSMGLPCPGYEIALLDPETREPVDVGETGEIAVKPREWLILREYWNMADKSEDAFYDGWLLTDDLAYRDEDGHYWYEGRADDVIISSGYRIGPFEVESSLIEHDVVAEAAVVGMPDEQRGEIVKAFVVPIREISDPEAVAEELKSYVKERLARHAYPREVEFVDELPTTATGKIQRYKLRGRNGRT